MKKVFQNESQYNPLEIDEFINNFKTQGEMLSNGKRNTIKIFKTNKGAVNIKSFKVPNLINQVAYGFFRKSKAKRSFEYSKKLLELGIRVPSPIAYYESKSFNLIKNSYYISEHLYYDLTFRDISLDYPDYENILRAFVRFTNVLHQNNVHFLDHSPGNTLIVKTNLDYQFYLVDVNRMRFEVMSFEQKINNFCKLTKDASILKIMSDEYAKCNGLEPDLVYNKIRLATNAFYAKKTKKKQLKKKLGL